MGTKSCSSEREWSGPDIGRRTGETAECHILGAAYFAVGSCAPPADWKYGACAAQRSLEKSKAADEAWIPAQLILIPSGSKYPLFIGPKSHLGYGFWDKRP